MTTTGKPPLLDRAVEARLWADYVQTRCLRLRNRLAEAYFLYAMDLANRIHARLSSDADLDEVCSAASLGLLDAITRFDPSRGVRFGTYCAQRIRGTVLDELRKLDRVPRATRLRAAAMSRTENALTAELGREPALEEMADRAGLSPEATMRVRNSDTRRLASIHHRDPAERRVSQFAQAREPDPADVVANRIAAEEALHLVNARERHMLTRYFFGGMTQQGIADEDGCCTESISLRKNTALRKIRARWEEAEAA
jgi:RNA polymerase sigma factor for flagellar operon FliA